MLNRIDGRLVTPEQVTRIVNCRLVKTQRTLNQLLMMVEHEIEQRSGKGGGGLK